MSGDEFLVSSGVEVRASDRKIEGYFRPDVKADVISVDYLDPSHGQRGICAETRLRHCSFRGLNRLALRGERWIVRQSAGNQIHFCQSMAWLDEAIHHKSACGLVPKASRTHYTPNNLNPKAQQASRMFPH